MESKAGRIRASSASAAPAADMRSGTSQAPTRLPVFPAKKRPSTGMHTKSPAKGLSAKEHLPQLPSQHGSAANASGDLHHQRTGAEQLAELGLQRQSSLAAGRNDNANQASEGTRGFDSPSLKADRAKIARDEVRAFMQQRQRQQAAKASAAPDDKMYQEPVSRDTSFDDDDTGTAPTVGRPAADGPAYSAYRDGAGASAQGMHPGSSAGTPHRTSYHDEDDVGSVDQSPTRHTPSGVRFAGQRVRPTSPALVAISSAYAERAGGTESPGRALGGPSAAQPSGPSPQRLSIRSLRISHAGLTDDAFEQFKRDVAARVIQAQWRRWQAWRAQVRREAEERILRELLGDDTGESLRLLLQAIPDQSSNVSSGAAVDMEEWTEAAAETTTDRGAGGATKDTAVALREGQAGAEVAPEASWHQHPVHGGRVQKDAAAANVQEELSSASVGGLSSAGGDLGSAAGSHLSRPSRPSSAAAQPAAAAARPLTPSRAGPGQRPRTAGAVAAPALTAAAARAEQPRRPASGSSVSPGAGRTMTPGRVRSAAAAPGRRDGSLLGNAGEDARVQPLRRHTGGHSVYSFVATPRRQSAAAEVEEEPWRSRTHNSSRDTESSDDLPLSSSRLGRSLSAALPSIPGTQRDPVLKGLDARRGSTSRPTADQEAQVGASHAAGPQRSQPSYPARDREDVSNGSTMSRASQHESGGGDGAVRSSAGHSPKRPVAVDVSLAGPSLDNDSNPAMASPSLSAATGGGGAVAPAQSPREATSWPAEGARRRRGGVLAHDEEAGTGASGVSDGRRQAAAPAMQASHLHSAKHMQTKQDDDTAPDGPQPPRTTAAQQQRQPSPGRLSRTEALQRLRGQGAARASILSPNNSVVPPQLASSFAGHDPSSSHPQPQPHQGQHQVLRASDSASLHQSANGSHSAHADGTDHGGLQEQLEVGRRLSRPHSRQPTAQSSEAAQPFCAAPPAGHAPLRASLTTASRERWLREAMDQLPMPQELALHNHPRRQQHHPHPPGPLQQQQQQRPHSAQQHPWEERQRQERRPSSAMEAHEYGQERVSQHARPASTEVGYHRKHESRQGWGEVQSPMDNPRGCELHEPRSASKGQQRCASGAQGGLMCHDAHPQRRPHDRDEAPAGGGAASGPTRPRPASAAPGGHVPGSAVGAAYGSTDSGDREGRGALKAPVRPHTAQAAVPGGHGARGHGRRRSMEDSDGSTSSESESSSPMDSRQRQQHAAASSTQDATGMRKEEVGDSRPSGRGVEASGGRDRGVAQQRGDDQHASDRGTDKARAQVRELPQGGTAAEAAAAAVAAAAPSADMGRQEQPLQGSRQVPQPAAHAVVANGGTGEHGKPGGVAVAASLTADKMNSILKFLDDVEKQADREASSIGLVPIALLGEASAGATAAAAASASPQPRSGSRPSSFGDAAGRQSMAASRRGTTTSRPATARTSASHALAMQRSVAAVSDAAVAVGRSRSRAASPTGHAAAGGGPLEGFGSEDQDDDAVSVGGVSGVSGATHGGRPAFLAESVYEGVRNRMRRLQDEVRDRDTQISHLQQEVEALHAAQRCSALESDERTSELLAAQRAEYEGAVARHLAFIDRLMADNGALNKQMAQLTEQLRAADERQERAICKLKDGWEVELRRQKEHWAAGEKQRRDAWMAAKAAEIKDVTVKGLEGEVQKLLSRHKAELAAVQQAAADEARRHLDTYVAQNELAVRQLKERLGREAEEAVEKERAAAATRLREVSERYEQQLQTQRMRLVADADLRLEQLEQARKEEKKRYEEALAAAREAGEERVRQLDEDWRREKEGLRKAHEKQLDSLREQYETGQEGWRAAMAERAKQEVEQRVAAIKDKLTQERNEEIEAVMSRLEAEHASAMERCREESRRREEAAATRSAAAVKEARKAEVKMAERFRAAGLASQAAEERVAAAELSLQEVRRELDAKNSTIRWLESQVSAAKEEAHARERDLRALGQEKAAVAADAVAAAEERLAQALEEQRELRSKHSAEMQHVEARVKATLARREEVIAGLREQVAAVTAELGRTQAVLRQQQEELGDDEYD